ncbi:mevalonate kinase [Phytohabitans houttuyneae]|uniref:mevalonate kinase n=1 Tax=Phytohabitans houttuyneae TaxID=1076126 RepID=A0A6V8K2H7_9ACTN|nr:mevalonate kinase [Phytohabitans houttuyneae]GFJ76379.1 mevalonate kinase [Phytohabitans houttuyneae]
MATTDSLTFADRDGSAAGAARGHTGTGRAHGKAILFGEHAVVYGAPALAIPVPRLPVTATATRLPSAGEGADQISFAIAGPGTGSATPVEADDLRHLVAEFKVRAGVTERVCVDVLIDCAIPRGCGLGSSAACARAAVLALGDLFGRRLDARTVFDLVQVSETAAHGRASGIDAIATGATAPLYFRAGLARELPVAMAGEGFPDAARAGAAHPWEFDGLFVIADSGASGSTKEAVEMLRGAFERDPRTKETFVREVAGLTHAALRDLGEGRVDDLGARLTENHRLLRDIGISTERIDTLVETAIAAGGRGAKISGGGLGGCMVALADDPRRAETIAGRLHEAGAVRTWVVPVGRFASYAH